MAYSQQLRNSAQSTTDIIKSHFTEVKAKQNHSSALFNMERDRSYSIFLAGLHKIPRIAPLYELNH